MPYSGHLKHEYSDFKENREETADSNLRKLIISIHTLLISTAECERGFSQMNLICTPPRSVITIGHMSSLLFVSLVDPPVGDCQPLPYVKSWLAMGRHDSKDKGKSRKIADIAVCEGR